MNLPLGYESMTPTQLALEVALHELSSLHGLSVVDAENPTLFWVIDNNEAIALIKRAIPIELSHTGTAQACS